MNKDSEHNIQASFVDWVLWTYARDETFVRPLFFSTLNGAFLGGGDQISRGRVMGKLKRAGALPGVSDILYLQPRGTWSYLALELKTEKRKREKDRGLSEEQEDFLNAVGSVGGLPSVCYGIDEAINTFKSYMSLESRAFRDFSFGLQSRVLSLKSEESRP